MNRCFWRKLWGLKLPGKVLNLICRACRSCLPTANTLAGKNVNVSRQCSWCQICVEDDIHVLFQCSFAREVWEHTGLSNLVVVWPNETILTVMRMIFPDRSYGSDFDGEFDMLESLAEEEQLGMEPCQHIQFLGKIKGLQYANRMAAG